MGWPYEFVDLTPEEGRARRLVLDRYARYAELLVMLPVLAAAVVRLMAWAVQLVRRNVGSSGGRDAYYRIPNSPALKSMRHTTRGVWSLRLRRVQWWLAEDVAVLGVSCGQRDLWLAGIAWTGLLFALCVLDTGRDYLHLTRRLGAVAAGQFPAQYILGLKWANPFGLVFGCSHELLNRWHRLLGVFIYVLLALHAALYLNFYVQSGILYARLSRPIVIAGLVALTGMTLMAFTSLVRVLHRWSYRLFFVTHVVVAVAVPPLIMYHAHHANVYMATSLLLLLADVTLRKINTVSTEAVVEVIPGTNLMRLSLPLPASKVSFFGDHPASHVYVSLPPGARPSRNPLAPSSLLYEFLFNPFTIESVNEETGELTLVVRAHKGPMTSALARYAVPFKASAKEEPEDDDDGDDDDDEAGEDAPAIPRRQQQAVSPGARPAASSSAPFGLLHLDLEGPYGASAHFPDLSAYNFDHVLLVAGGVGATFAVPLYCATRNSPGLKVDFVWAVRDAAEAAWAAIPGPDGGSIGLLSDPSVHLFVTGGRSSTDGTDGQSVELTRLGSADSRFAPGGSHRRPDLARIVDDVFRQGAENRVAVLVCGPEAMAREMRASVGVWVRKGRSVWWHNETFGW